MKPLVLTVTHEIHCMFLFAGYDLRQVNSYISKVFENIGELAFHDPDESDKGLFEITGVRSVLNEHLPFKQVCFMVSILSKGILVFLLFRILHKP